MIFLSIKLPSNSVDVNLEPNKTKVLLTEKEKILDAIKTELEKFYKKGIGNPPSLNSEDRDLRCKPNSLGKDTSSLGSENMSQEEKLNDDDKDSSKSIDNSTSSSSGEQLADVFNMNDTFIPLASSTQSEVCIMENGKKGPNNLSIKEVPLSKNNIEKPELSCWSPKKMIPVNLAKDRDGIQHVLDHSESPNVTSNSLSLENTPLKVDGEKDDINGQCKGSTSISVSDNAAVQGCSQSKGIQESNESNSLNNVNTATSSNLGQGLSFSASNEKGFVLDKSCDSQNSTLSLGKEDVSNIYKLLDLSEKENQISHTEEEMLELPISPNQQCQPPTPQDKNVVNGKDDNNNNYNSNNNSSFQLDSVFDDLEFDEILKDIADKKTGSQTSHSMQSSESNSQTVASKVKDMVDLTTGKDKAIGSKEWSIGNILKDKQNNLVEVCGAVNVEVSKVSPTS